MKISPKLEGFCFNNKGEGPCYGVDLKSALKVEKISPKIRRYEDALFSWRKQSQNWSFWEAKAVPNKVFAWMCKLNQWTKENQPQDGREQRIWRAACLCEEWEAFWCYPTPKCLLKQKGMRGEKILAYFWAHEEGNRGSEDKDLWPINEWWKQPKVW